MISVLLLAGSLGFIVGLLAFAFGGVMLLMKLGRMLFARPKA